jgi:RimJ/RimL family protein N-acetyltransferase
MKINSKRLYLRELTVDDVTQQYPDWLNDDDVNKFLEVRHIFHTISSCRDFVENTNGDENSYLFGIFERSNNNHIGNAKIGPIRREHETAEISLFIGEKSSRGKSYGKEVIHCLTKYGFESLRLARIEAWCYEKNIGSLRAFLSLGYSLEGFMKKKYISDGVRCGAFAMGMLREEFNIHNSQNSAWE